MPAAAGETAESLRGLARMLETGAASASALVTGALARIAARDQRADGPNAVAALNPNALTEAQDAEAGPGQGPLTGLPVMVKDNIDVSGMATTAGSPLMRGNVAVCDAVCVRRLRESGAILLGKTTLHEWASGITSVSALHGAVRNARSPGHVAGGSSGGSAGAVAARYVAAAIGTDTAGSIRIPAAFHGLYGLRPTHGRLDMTGIVPLCPSQDVVGPIARDPLDLAILMDVLGGQPAGAFSGRIEHGILRRARVGVLRALFGNDGQEAGVSETCLAALERMRRQGVELVDLDATGLAALAKAASTIDYEFAPAIAGYLRGRDGLSIRSLDDIVAQTPPGSDLAETLKRRLLAARQPEAALGLALERRAELRAELERLLQDHGLTALAYPTMRMPPARIGARQPGFENVFLSASSGFPALTVPALPEDAPLPVGLEFLGRPGTEATLLSIACDWQEGRALTC